MNLYSKDFLLDGKIVYYQLKKGYRSGIEPIILASNAKKKHNDFNFMIYFSRSRLSARAYLS